MALLAFTPVLPLQRCATQTQCITSRRARAHARVAPRAALQEPPPPTKTPEVELNDTNRGGYFNEEETMYQGQLKNAAVLAAQNFGVEFNALMLELQRALGLCPKGIDMPPTCLGFTLSNAGIAARESAREEREGRPAVWPPVRAVYSSVCYLLDVVYDGRPIERFWVLETVARLPYLAYSSCLHLLGTLGWFRSATLMTLHRNEDLNEAMHLAVMEALGGDQRWLDRFTAFHSSILYFWILVLLFFVSPRQSYGFSQLLEAHAVDTYGQFLDENEEALRQLPVPDVAHVYFSDFLFYYQDMQLGTDPKQRPQLNSLYDVFANILADEMEHSKAMDACGKFVLDGNPVVYNGKTVQVRPRQFDLEDSRRHYWKQWREKRNRKGD